jgi:Ca-activated chloride channel family protein
VNHLTFAYPFVLAGLVAVPLLLVLYVVSERRRGKVAARFATPALLPNLLPRRPGFRRHVAPLLGLLALAALVAGAARPQRPSTQARKQATVILAIDTSRSMGATDVRPTRLAAAESAARTLVAELPADARVGLVAFTRTARVVTAPTSDRGVIDGAIRGLQLGGGTAVGDAIVTSLGLLPKPPAGSTSPHGAIVLLSDGATTEGKIGPVAAARQAHTAHVPVYTVALGTSSGEIKDPVSGAMVAVPPDAASLAAVARAAGGSTYSTGNASELRAIYDRIGRTVGHLRVEQDLAIAFIGIAGALLLIAAGASLRWFRTLA